jgi:hypothetical protein
MYTVSDSPPYRLTALSQEFVLPQASTDGSSSSAGSDRDAEIIQFASGLEVADGRRILIAYGINDCEAAIVQVSAEYAFSRLLRRIEEPGKQVVNFMQPLKAA